MSDYDIVDAQIYDDFCAQVKDDLPFYLEEASRSRTLVLEIGCGTGRVMIPLAEAGVLIVGLDRSSAMLEIARRKLSNLPSELRNNIRLIESDARKFALGECFDLILIPFDTFMFLHTRDDQMKALQCMHNHLLSGGRLIVTLFDPSAETISESTKRFGPLKKFSEFVRSQSGRKVASWFCQRCNPLDQIIETTFLFDELNDDSAVLQRTYSSVTLRWTHRFEMHNLLELCGFEIEALYGDYRRNPFQHGTEQIWVARKCK